MSKKLSKRRKSNPVYDKYRMINERLSGGREVYLNKNAPADDSRYLIEKNMDAEKLHNPAIAVYVGSGASHSWLWFVDILEAMGFSDINFLSEDDIAQGLADRDALLISGGETFALAHGLGEKGRGAVVDLLERGGLYFGSCAGACMMMRSTTEPLGLFDLVNIKIANIVDELPEQIKPSNKFSSPYGCALVFHPVREEIVLESFGTPPFYINGNFTAPLYGGPPMEESDEVIILAKYKSFTQKTDYLAAPEKAEEILLGKTAVCMKKQGKGHIILCGPHLEHPSFPEANALVADSIYYSQASSKGTDILKDKKVSRVDKKDLTEIKRQVSNLRIIALGLEHNAISWLIGRKYYEPEKIRTYAESLWKRITIFEKSIESEGISADPVLIEKAVTSSNNALETIRTLKDMVGKDEPSDRVATKLFTILRALSKDFYTCYFSRTPLK